MGFLDKLFGSNGSDMLNKIKDAANSVAKEAENAINSAVNAANGSANNSQPAGARPAPAKAPAAAQETSGDSWGPTMPAEDNQYNYQGTYDQYFMDVFTQNFPMYRITSEKMRKDTATVITFWKGLTEEKALIVELLSENSCAEKIRYQARKESVPYIRFYYNHEGWWNTKSYVIRRTKEALKI